MKTTKQTILTIAFTFVGTILFAQNQYMTWSHSGGHTPSQYLTVDCNEPFEFWNVGSQTHPVAEGGFGASTDPTFWPSQNLVLTPSYNQSNPMVITIPNAGIYNFKCGNNPTKQSLWGRITVTGPGCSTASPSWDCVAGSCVDPGTGNGLYATLSACQTECSVSYVEDKSNSISVFPNPASDIITIQGWKANAEIFDMNGKKVMDAKDEIVDISKLPNGTYIIKSEEMETIFIKE